MCEDTIERYKQLNEKVNKFIEDNNIHCQHCHKDFHTALNSIKFIVRDIEERRIVIDVYCRQCRRHLRRVYCYWDGGCEEE